MSILLHWLHRLILLFCVVLIVLIIGALAVQIFSRYVLNAPVHMTDDIAEISLVWLTFLGAAAVYRERGHIAVEFVQSLESESLKRGIRIVIHALVAVVLGFVVVQVWQLYPLKSRLTFGTVPISTFTTQFALVMLPFGVGAGLTIVFAIEAIARDLAIMWRGGA